MSDGDFKLELENAGLRKLLELAATDAARRDSAEKLQRLILEELHHRVKNTLAIVQAIVNQSVRTAVDLPHAGEAISARFSALGRVHDLLLRTGWSGAMLPELLKTAVEPFESPGREQFRIQPTPIRINPAAALPFVMTINELCTNATKHGALTVPEGRVNIATKVNEGSGTFHFKWSEKGGSPRWRAVAPKLRNVSPRKRLRRAILGLEANAIQAERRGPRMSNSSLRRRRVDSRDKPTAVRQEFCLLKRTALILLGS